MHPPQLCCRCRPNISLDKTRNKNNCNIRRSFVCPKPFFCNWENVVRLPKRSLYVAHMTLYFFRTGYWPRIALLTHWGRNKMAAIFQTTLSSAFSWMKIFKFRLRFHWSNIPALVQIMAWRRSGDKPLSEPMMVSLPAHICVTRPQWVNWFPGCVNWTAFLREQCNDLH